MHPSIVERTNGDSPSRAIELALFTSFALPSAALSATLPWAAGSLFMAPDQPLAPPVYFAAALCFGLYQEASVKATEVMIVFISIFATWTAAYHAAHFGRSFFLTADQWIPSQFGAQAAFVKAHFLVFTGIVAGVIGGLGTSASIAAVRKAVRSRGFFFRTTAIAAAAGGLLAAPNYLRFAEHLLLYLVWQPAVAWSIARDLIEERASQRMDDKKR
jgi:hypothetical protein